MLSGEAKALMRQFQHTVGDLTRAVKDLTDAVKHNNKLMIEYGRIMEGFNPPLPHTHEEVPNASEA